MNKYGLSAFVTDIASVVYPVMEFTPALVLSRKCIWADNMMYSISSMLKSPLYHVFPPSSTE